MLKKLLCLAIIEYEYLIMEISAVMDATRKLVAKAAYCKILEDVYEHLELKWKV